MAVVEKELFQYIQQMQMETKFLRAIPRVRFAAVLVQHQIIMLPIIVLTVMDLDYSTIMKFVRRVKVLEK